MTTPKNDTEDPTKNEKKKKKVKAPIVVPPTLNSALLIVKGVLAGVTGTSILKLNELNAKAKMQPMFLKEAPRKTGKILYSYGKPNQLICELDLSINEDMVLKEIQNIINDNLDIRQYISTRSAVCSAYGEDALKAFGLDTLHDEENVYVTFVQDVTFELSSKPIDLAKVKKINLEYNGPKDRLASFVGVGSRKVEIGIKFEAISDGEEKIEISEAVNGLPDISKFVEKTIRLGSLTNTVATSESENLEKEKTEGKEDEEMIVNAFEVKGVIDYNKLVDQFGSKLISPELLDRFERVVKQRGGDSSGDVKLHRFLRRGMFFSHRDLDRILTLLEENKAVYLYTGRGPSSAAMHLGHLIPFHFTAYLQRALKLPCVIQMTDDEKFLFKGQYDPEEGDNLTHFAGLTIENAKDILSCGFEKNRTFLFSNLNYLGPMYPNVVRLWKAVTNSTVSGIFGFVGSDNIGKTAFPAIQAAPSFPSSFPVVLNAKCALLSPTQTKENLNACNAACLIPCAIDQDPYFRMTRDVAHKIVPKSHPLGGKPALIHSKFFPPLQGSQGKMSSSDTNSAIFLTDSAEEIERKIKTQAFSGGQDTGEKQRELGADLNLDVPYQWLTFFMEDDDLLKEIANDYSSGSGTYWSTGAVKKKLIEVLQELVSDHQKRRSLVDESEVREWMRERSIL